MTKHENSNLNYVLLRETMKPCLPTLNNVSYSFHCCFSNIHIIQFPAHDKHSIITKSIALANDYLLLYTIIRG